MSAGTASQDKAEHMAEQREDNAARAWARQLRLAECVARREAARTA